MHIAEARLEQSLIVVIDALPVIGQNGGFVMHDTPMPDRQVDWFFSSESHQEEVVQVSMHGELEQVSSSESQ